MAQAGRKNTIQVQRQEVIASESETRGHKQEGKIRYKFKGRKLGESETRGHKFAEKKRNQITQSK